MPSGPLQLILWKPIIKLNLGKLQCIQNSAALKLLQTCIDFPVSHRFIRNCTGCPWNPAQFSNLWFTNLFSQVFHSTLILISCCTAVVTSDSIKMLEVPCCSKFFPISVKQCTCSLAFDAPNYGTSFLMKCVHPSRLGPFDGSSRHVFSTRHTQLDFKLTGCSQYAESRPSLVIH